MVLKPTPAGDFIVLPLDFTVHVDNDRDPQGCSWEEWPVQSELELCSLIGLLWLSDFIYEEQNSVHHLEDTQVQDSCRQAKRLKE